MPWVKVDDDLFDHIKIIRAGRDARDLWLAAVLFSAKNLTDGFIPCDVLDYLALKAGVTNPADLAHRLVDVNLWEEAECGWNVHDFHDYNPSAQQVRGERAAARDRMKRARGGALGDDEPPLFANHPRGSDYVRPKFDGTSPEHVPKFGQSSDPPYPDPVPDSLTTNVVNGEMAPPSAAPNGAISHRSFLESAQTRLKATNVNANRVAGDIFQEIFGIKPNYPLLGKMLKAYQAPFELVKLMMAIQPMWNGTDDPNKYLLGAFEKQHGSKPGANGKGRAVDGGLSRAEEYLKLYDEKRAREKEVQGDPQQSHPTTA